VIQGSRARKVTPAPPGLPVLVGRKGRRAIGGCRVFRVRKAQPGRPELADLPVPTVFKVMKVLPG
jgi:hypothetical protein